MPVPLLATLVSGLGTDSRIGMIEDGRKVGLGTYLLAELCDMLEMLLLSLSGKSGSPARAGCLVCQDGQADSGEGYTVEGYNQLRESLMKKGEEDYG